MRVSARYRAPLVLGAWLIAACGGGDGGGNSITPPSGTPAPSGPTVVSLAPSTATALPLQQVEIVFPSSAGVAGATLAGTFGTRSVVLSLSDSVRADFLVPPVAGGSYTLTVDFGTAKRGTASITVTPAPVIADPAAVVTTAVNSMTAQADSLVAAVRATTDGSLGLTTADADYLAGKSAELKSKLSQASATDLAEYAAFLAANPGLFPAATASAQVLGLQSLAPASVLSASELSNRVNAFIAAYASKKIAVVRTIALCVGGITVTSWTGIVGALVASGCAVSIGWQAADIAQLMKQEISNLYAVPTAMFIDNGALLASAATEAMPVAGQALIAVDPGQTRHVQVRVAVRTISSADRGILGSLFAAVDEVASALGRVTKYLPGWAVPSFAPPSTATSTSDFVPGSDLTVSLQGCSVTNGGDGVDIRCDQVSTTDLNLTASFTYRNSFGTASGTLPVTVRRTFASASTPVVVQTGTYRGTAISPAGDSFTKAGCNFTITIPIQGNTPIKFTTWNGVWTRGHTEAGTSNYTVDPRQFSGLVWLTNQLFWDGWGINETPTPFTIAYTVNFTVPATGQSGSVFVSIPCSP